MNGTIITKHDNTNANIGKSKSKSLLESLLQPVLPEDNKFEIFQLQNQPCQTYPLVTLPRKASSSSSTPPMTVKVQHFFTLSHNEKIIYALEIYVYINIPMNERSIFISKADTNGYSDIQLNIKDITKTILKYILSIDPNHYLQKVKPLERKKGKKSHCHRHRLIMHYTNVKDTLKILSNRLSKSFDKEKQAELLAASHSTLYLDLRFTNEQKTQLNTKICLFTRPAGFYLFTDSDKNPKKHNLNGSGLLKWWIRIIDQLINEEFIKQNTVAKLRVPGEDPMTVKRRFLYDQKTLQFNNWKHGDIFNGNDDDFAVSKIPLFPDDPKSRFIRELVQQYDEDATTNRMDLKTYWIELQERQEFKSSDLVSIIGVSGIVERLPKYIPAQEETLICSSNRQFKYIKSYVTGEEYDTEEGAMEAYLNVKDYLKWKYNKDILLVRGEKEKYESSRLKRANNVTITLLQPRKRVKK
ncbi:H3 histone acetyltransferase RTT109 NDAI_0K02420 [Naumovozyma dairenensis CBS 421]|uniref:histone acetyltransferase n=1 Tax=Naumovozyma dairenensis (strain ATCC 10597 / BCRC 20456 / CBS 421 / NBRC 0211 / NRRL Y-12639) TaxID=1071378 RepID=G0WI22_NAUDC|nr:hypothetical protein NDAI_0K02420 [Naumovozyma dairenensis CBS 421]CCD27433.1 hypothetical protein NDAI_0K02420 [Naumovozyma dairenensis CBS 421]